VIVRTLVLPAKVGVGGTKLGLKVGSRTVRFLGYRRLLVFAAGVGVGLLFAPMAGRELRARLRALAAAQGSGGGLAERVSFELAHSPRTWHLPQPEVEVIGGTAILRGEVPHEVGRADLERAAAAVAGVVDVDNHVAISGTNSRQ